MINDPRQPFAQGTPRHVRSVVLDDHTVAYLDLFGSGVETIAHLSKERPDHVMFCSVNRIPRILRLFGTGRIVRPADAQFGSLKAHFGLQHPGIRAVIVIEMDRVADSCGFSVPRYGLIGERPMLDAVQGDLTRCSLSGLPATIRRASMACPHCIRTTPCRRPSNADHASQPAAAPLSGTCCSRSALRPEPIRAVTPGPLCVDIAGHRHAGRVRHNPCWSRNNRPQSAFRRRRRP